ncbi:valine--tRNA ligase, mitochondrial isoform X1, partial [Lates japonicus]
MVISCCPVLKTHVILKMWRVGRVLSLRLAGRGATRLCSSNPPKPSASLPKSSPRPQAEKQRRRREREEAILTSKHS